MSLSVVIVQCNSVKLAPPALEPCCARLPIDVLPISALKILDVGGFDSSVILNLRGGIIMSRCARLPADVYLAGETTTQVSFETASTIVRNCEQHQK